MSSDNVVRLPTEKNDIIDSVENIVRLLGALYLDNKDDIEGVGFIIIHRDREVSTAYSKSSNPLGLLGAASLLEYRIAKGIDDISEDDEDDDDERV